MISNSFLQRSYCPQARMSIGFTGLVLMKAKLSNTTGANRKLWGTTGLIQG